ncbi:MAG: hypothetical protein ACTH9Z_00380 [Bavariicoccus seileri]
MNEKLDHDPLKGNDPTFYIVTIFFLTEKSFGEFDDYKLGNQIK